MQWKKEGIEWESDQDIAFQDGPIPPWTEANNSLINDPDFIVWMRLATFSNFVKLYRVVTEDLEPGIYFMDIESRKDSSPSHSTGDERSTWALYQLTFSVACCICFQGIRYNHSTGRK